MRCMNIGRKGIRKKNHENGVGKTKSKKTHIQKDTLPCFLGLIKGFIDSILKLSK